MQLCSVPEPECYKEMGGIICPLMRQCAFPSQNPTVKQLTRLGSCSFTNLPSALNYSESWLSIFLFSKHASSALGFPNNFSFFHLFPNFSCLSAMCLTSMPTSPPMPLSFQVSLAAWIFLFVLSLTPLGSYRDLQLAYPRPKFSFKSNIILGL